MGNAVLLKLPVCQVNSVEPSPLIQVWFTFHFGSRLNSLAFIYTHKFAVFQCGWVRMISAVFTFSFCINQMKQMFSRMISVWRKWLRVWQCGICVRQAECCDDKNRPICWTWIVESVLFCNEASSLPLSKLLVWCALSCVHIYITYCIIINFMHLHTDMFAVRCSVFTENSSVLFFC